jgi:hypothetical protein
MKCATVSRRSPQKTAMRLMIWRSPLVGLEVMA